MSNPILDGAFTLTRKGLDSTLVPFEYTGVDDEILAHKTGAHIAISLHYGTPVYDVEGPDAWKFLNSICVNTFKSQKLDNLRHAIICNEKGQIMTDGVVIRLSENKYRTYWLQPVIQWLCETSDLDVTGKDISQEEFFFQIAGPKSLQILEEACEEDLHDIAFAHHRLSSICGVETRVIRLGMTGGLAYEIHGDRSKSDVVYSRIWEVGKKYGLKKVGSKAYTMMHHTEGGFPNINIHYPLPWYEDPDFAKWLDEHPGKGFSNYNRYLIGSVGDDIESRFVTPYDVGWEFLIKFNHEFRGRKALEKLANEPHRTVVTLEWDADDVAEIYKSQFMGPDAVQYERIDKDCDMEYNLQLVPRFHYHADKVLQGDKQVGISVGRINSYFYHRMISLGFIDSELAKEGNQFDVLWGTPGKPQKRIRAKVVRFPFTDVISNQDFDVETIPHFTK